MFNNCTKLQCSPIYNFLRRRLIRRKQTFVQNLSHQIIFSDDEFHTISKGTNLETCKHSSFLIVDEIVLNKTCVPNFKN